jgi:Tol biopolymer transport system component
VQGDYVLEIIDAASGASRGRLLIETGKGSFGLTGAIVAGDRLLLSDTLGRVLSYSTRTRELQGHAFGDEPAISAPAGLLAVNTGGGRVVLYDLDTMARKDQLTFANEVVLKAFSPDGTKLFALTSDQTAIVIGLR